MVASDTTSETWRNNVLMLYTLILTAGSVGFIVTSFLWFLGEAPISDNTVLSDTTTTPSEPAKPEGNESSTTTSTTPTEPTNTTRLLQETPDAIVTTPSCSANITLISITIIMMIAVCGLRCRKENSIFTAAIVNLWLTYLLWSALASQSDECNTLQKSSGATFF